MEQKKSLFIFVKRLLSDFHFEYFWQADTLINLQLTGNTITHRSSHVFSPYLVKHSLCQSVANHSNVMFKSHSKLPVTDQHITTNVESDCLRFDTCNTTISPLISESISIPDCHVLMRRCFSSSINLSHWFLINSFRCYGFRLSVAVFTAVERRSLTGELSLSCTWPAADGSPLMLVNRPL